MFIFSMTKLLTLMFLFGFMSFCKNRIHLLMILMSLEFMMLIIYLMLIFYLNLYEMELYFSMISSTFSVCESVSELSISILMVRMHGNNYFQALSIL